MTEYHSVGDGSQQIFESGAKLLGEEQRYEGKKYVYCYASTTVTAGTPVMITKVSTTTQNPNLVALATSTNTAQNFMVGVPVVGMVAADTDWVQVEGPATITVASATYTAGDGLKVHDGVVTDMGAAFIQAATEFAVVASGQTSATATSCEVYLLGREVLSTT